MWIKEYTFNILIQPFHLLMYTVLIGAALDLAQSSLLYSIVAIYFIIPAEKLLRKLFRFDSAGTLSAAGSFAGGALFTSLINKINRPKPKDKDEDDSPTKRPNSSSNRIRMGKENPGVGGTPVGNGTPRGGDTGGGNGSDGADTQNGGERQNPQDRMKAVRYENGKLYNAQGEEIDPNENKLYNKVSITPEDDKTAIARLTKPIARNRWDLMYSGRKNSIFKSRKWYAFIYAFNESTVKR